MSYTENDTIIPRNVEEEVKESYLRYSMSVIIARALPDARDGLKPSHRRILYAMRQLNLSAGSKHRKCAKISGDTSGDFHPHGEQVIYPTLVRMAQEWAMRYKLIDGQGNFGSVDGDPPAAMRYTEARLTHASMQLMEDLDKNTVDMVSNYDETKKEPTVFPAKFPNLLCNGSSGIAVGMATNIPPHNLQEIVKATCLILDNPLTTIEEILRVMPGPDFPTGGIICGIRGIHEAYHTGRGKLTLRGKIHIEEQEKYPDRQRIIVDEIPYNVNKARLIEHIADLINSKTLTSIADLRDDSDKSGLRITIDLKKGEVVEVVINQLYKFTDLQVTFGCNMLALDKGLPRTMGVKQLLEVWIEHRIEVVRRRTRFELNKAEARVHILEGYIKALEYLDAIVKIIRAQKDRLRAKEELVAIYGFSEKQAQAVLDLRLYQLTSLESDNINDEHQKLVEKMLYLRSVLMDELLVKGIIKEELHDAAKQCPSERLTQIIPAETDMEMEDLIPNEPTILTLSHDNYIKRMPVDTFREQKRGGLGVSGVDFKTEDTLKLLYVANTHDHLLLFTNLGRVYWLKAWEVPEASRKAKGRPIINFLSDLKEGESIRTILKTKSLEDDAYIVMVTQKGTIKKTNLKEFSHPRKNGVWAIDIAEGDTLMSAHLAEKGNHIMLFSNSGMAVRFDEEKIRSMGRMARGVRGIRLKDENDKVVACEVVKGDESILVVCENGFGKRSQVEEFRVTNRGGKGVRSISTSDRNGAVIGALSVADDESIVMMSKEGQTMRMNMKNMRVMGRNTQGVTLTKLKIDDKLVAIQKLQAQAQEDEIEAE
jgi:DNA gyrase subunit A